MCAVLCPHSFRFPFLFHLNRVWCVQVAPPAVGQAPDLMTNPRMAALVAPIDAAVLFPFYTEVNINNAKFRWYKTGQLEENSKSFYAVPVLLHVACCLCPVAGLSCPVLPCLALSCLVLPGFAWLCLSCVPRALAPSTFLIGAVAAHILELSGGQNQSPRASFAGARTSTSGSVAG